jgi:hypothetical protein
MSNNPVIPGFFYALKGKPATKPKGGLRIRLVPTAIF